MQTALPLAEQVAAHILRSQAQRIGSRVFTVCGNESLTYAQADQRADRVAAALHALNVGKGARVALLMQNSLTFLDLWFGLTRIGAIQLPLNTAYKSVQLLHTLKRAPVTAVVVDDALLPELEAIIDQVVDLKYLIVNGNAKPRCKCKYLFFKDIFSGTAHEPPAVTVTGADISAIMNTSGTTGPSKGVLLPHAQQYVLGRNIARDLALSESDVYYNFFPLFHNTAQAMITLPVLLAGCQMVLIERFSVTRFWPDVRAFGCTAFYYIGEILRLLLKSTEAHESQGTKLRIGWGIGAAPADFLAFQSRHGVRLRTGYGSTEANVPIFSPPEHSNAASVGRCLPEFEVRVADENCAALPAGKTGEILVRSSEPCAVMQGYDGDAKATVETWKDLWFHTGDAGYFDANGDLFFVGRLRDAIRVRGENVSAFEVEEAVSQVKGVIEVAAIAVPCELGGDDVKIAVVARPEAKLSAETIIAEVEHTLPRYALPRYVEFVTALPKTETNKVRKNILRETPFTPKTWDRLAAHRAAQQLQQS